jgi:hypothetical protein
MPEGYYTVQEASGKLGVSQEDFLRTVSSAGLKKYQDQGQLVFKTEDIDRLAASKPPSSGGPGVFQSSSSGLFDVDDLMAELGTATGKPAAAGSAAADEPTVMAGGKSGKPAGAGAPKSSGAVMSDSGLFNVKELVQEADIISKNTVTDDTTVVEPTGRRKGGGGGAVMSDSGLFDVREAVGDTTQIQNPNAAPPAPASKAPLSRGAVMSDSGVFNIQSNVEQMAAPPAAGAPKAPAPSLEGALSSGAVMSDSGLFDVRDLVSEADARAGKGDAPTKTVKGSAYSRPASLSPTGGSDSGLFTPTPGDDEKTRAAAPIRGPAPAGAKGITIFDPEDFNVNKFADPSAATAVGAQGGAAFAAPTARRDPKQGSGMGLRSPQAAREGTSLGGEVMPRTPSGSAIFSGEGRAAPAHAQTEVNMSAQRSSSSGIFGSQGRAPANMQTAILDAQPVDESTEGNVDTATQPQLVPRRGPAARATGRSQTVAALQPVQVEPTDHFEPFFAFFMFLGVVMLAVGSLMHIFSMGGLQPDFIRGFVANAKFVLIAAPVVVLLGLFAGWIYARNKAS